MPNPDRGKPAEHDQLIVQRRHRLLEGLVRLDDAVVLDFGCGNGAQTMLMSGPGRRIIGVDIDIADLESMAGRLRRQEVAGILPVRYDGRNLPLGTATVDVVTSFEVLEHVPDESNALLEMRRVLRPGGNLVLSVPNKGWIFETHGARLPLLPWNRIPFLPWLPHVLHGKIARARIYRKTDIVGLLHRSGFSVQSAVYVTAPMDVVRWPAVQRLLRTTVFRGDTTGISILSTAVLVHATKTETSS